MHYKKIVTMSATANYAAVKIFPAYHKGGKNRSQKKNATSEAAIKRNKKAMTMKVWTKIVSNFSDGDWFLTLTYSDAPTTKTEAATIFRQFKRKIKKECAKQNIEVRSIWTPPEIGKEKGRLHHHLVINKEVPLNLIQTYWTYGVVNISRLDEEKYKTAYYGLAEYIVKDTAENYDRKRDLHKKAYSCTKNLLEGITKKTMVKKQVVTVPKGWQLVEESLNEYLDEYTGELILEYKLKSVVPRPNTKWFKGKIIPISEAYTMAKEYIEEQLSLF